MQSIFLQCYSPSVPQCFFSILSSFNISKPAVTGCVRFHVGVKHLKLGASRSWLRQPARASPLKAAPPMLVYTKSSHDCKIGLCLHRRCIKKKYRCFTNFQKHFHNMSRFSEQCMRCHVGTAHMYFPYEMLGARVSFFTCIYFNDLVVLVDIPSQMTCGCYFHESDTH